MRDLHLIAAVALVGCGSSQLAAQLPARAHNDSSRATNSTASSCPPACLQCPCCDNLSVRVHAACMPSSAPLLSLLWAAGAGAGQMNHLQLTDCHTSAAAVLAPLPPFIPEALGAAAFRRLDTLMLSKCSPVGGESLAGFLSALLPRLPALTDLELEACDLSPAAEAEGLGGALSLAPHLTSLDMNECGLAQLPTGPYLAGASCCWSLACQIGMGAVQHGKGV